MGIINLSEAITDAHWIITDGGFGETIVLYGTGRSDDKELPIAQIMVSPKDMECILPFR